MDKFDVIVVGGGMAGLSATSFLKKENIDTLLIEKEDKLGGLVNSFQYQGFHFDGGIRSFEDSGMLFSFLRNFDIDLEFEKSIVSIGFKDKFVKIKTKEDIEKYFSMLKYLFPENEKDIEDIEREIKNITKFSAVTTEIDNPLLMEEEDLKNLRFLFFTLLPWLLKEKRYREKLKKYKGTAREFLEKFTENELLIDMIIQHFFKNTPAKFALSYFNMYLDYYYPKGGTGKVVEELENYILENEGKILKSEKALEINNIEKYVLTNKGKYFYYDLIWAADEKYFYDILLDDQKEKIRKRKELIGRNKGTDSVFTLFLGVDLGKENFQKLGPHSFYTPSLKGLSSLGPWEENKKNLKSYLEKYLEYTTFEISIPVYRDENLAPKGKTGMIISTLMDYSLVDYIYKNLDYEKFKKETSEKIISIFEENLFDNFSENILFSISSTPKTIERITGNYQGTISGWENSDEKIVESDFRKMTDSVKTEFSNIYRVGQWTFSPGGVPVSILTGKLAANKISKEKSK